MSIVSVSESDTDQQILCLLHRFHDERHANPPELQRAGRRPGTRLRDVVYDLSRRREAESDHQGDSAAQGAHKLRAETLKQSSNIFTVYC